MRKVLQAAHYAAERHTHQRRKGAAAEPYVNHVIDVARRCAEARPDDETLLVAALLHDVVEDTDGTRDEIAARFGEAVADVVMEVTDDKSLPKAERKRRQVETAQRLSDTAKRLKLADKASNLAAIAESPPPDWSHERLAEYVTWAESVVAGLRGVDAGLERAFDAAAGHARQKLGVSA